MSGNRPPPPPKSARRVPPPAPGAERRRTPRYELLAQIEVAAGGEVALMSVANLSAGGARVALAAGEVAPGAPGAQVTVFLDLGAGAGGEPVELRAPAEIVRVVGDGFALMWTSEDPEVAAQLARLLAHVRELAGETTPGEDAS